MTRQRRVLVVGLAVLLCGWWWASQAEVGPVRAAEPPRPMSQPPLLAPSVVAREVRAVTQVEPPPAQRAPDAEMGGQLDGAASPPLAEVNTWLEHNAQTAEQVVERFCAKSQRLTTSAALASTLGDGGPGADAAVYLGVRVDWESGRTGLLHLAASLTERMSSPPKSWLNFTPTDYQGLDFEWLKDLRAYSPVHLS